MTDLKKVLNNPFLRESPFRPRQNFYSASKSSSAQSSSLRQSSSGYLDLSYKTSSATAAVSDLDYKKYENAAPAAQLRKKSNPFHRRHLITASKECDYDHVEFGDHSALPCQGQIKRPDFLPESRVSYLQNLNNISKYQDLSSLNPPTPSQKQKNTYSDLEVKPSPATPTSDSKINKQNNPVLKQGYSMSPRFLAINLREEPPSQRHLPDQGRVEFGECETPNKRSVQRRESERRLLQDIPQRDWDQQESPGRSRGEQSMGAVGKGEDDMPQSILVRGMKFYRNEVKTRA